MDTLPQELFDRIFLNLDFEDLEKTLTVSSRFQHATEARRGWFKIFKMTSSNTENFIDFCKSHRLRYLEHVDFQATAPELEVKSEWSDMDCDEFSPCRDTVEDLRAIDERFTSQIHHMFMVLKGVEKLMAGLKMIKLTIRTPIREIPNKYCMHRQNVCWRVHLISPDELPKLFSINWLKVKQSGRSFDGDDFGPSALKLDLRVLLDLCVKLPNLETLRCKLLNDNWNIAHPSESLKHFTRNWEGPYRDTRHDFASAFTDLESQLSSNLRHVHLNFIDQWRLARHIDQRQPLPNLVIPLSSDPFCTSLRLLSYRLRTLRLRVVADSALFWGSDGDTLPFWPNLENLEVTFHMATPKGGWYFQGLKADGRDSEGFEITDASYPPLGPNSDDEMWDDRADTDIHMDTSIAERLQFRIVPDDDNLAPFLDRYAKATSNMPSLKKAALWCPLRFEAQDVDGFYREYTGKETRFDDDDERDLAWGLVYAAAGEESFHAMWNRPKPRLSSSRRLWWKVGNWRPVGSLHVELKKIGCGTHDNLEEIWDDEVYGQNLVAGSIFEKLAVSGPVNARRRRFCEW